VKPDPRRKNSVPTGIPRSFQLAWRNCRSERVRATPKWEIPVKEIALYNLEGYDNGEIAQKLNCTRRRTVKPDGVFVNCRNDGIMPRGSNPTEGAMCHGSIFQP
jgi:hypothetical protein